MDLLSLCPNIPVSNPEDGTYEYNVGYPDLNSLSCVLYDRYRKFTWIDAYNYCSDMGKDYGVNGRLVFITDTAMSSTVEVAKLMAVGSGAVTDGYIGLRSNWIDQTTDVGTNCKDVNVKKEWAWYEGDVEVVSLGTSFPSCLIDDAVIENCMIISWDNLYQSGTDMRYEDDGCSSLHNPICELYL